MEPTARPSTARPEEFDEFDTYGLEYGEYDPSSNERTMALLAHLLPLLGFGFIAPLVIYLVKKDDSDFVADQAREALNFQITLFIGFIASVVLMFVLTIFMVIQSVLRCSSMEVTFTSMTSGERKPNLRSHDSSVSQLGRNHTLPMRA